MEIKLPTGFIVKWLSSLYSYIFKQPRIDIAFIINSEGKNGIRTDGVSQNQPNEVMSVTHAIQHFRFHWSYNLLIKNNSSHTAYNLKIESIKGKPYYIEKLAPLQSLKEAENINLQCDFLYEKETSSFDAKGEYDRNFPTHLDEIKIIVSYTNEARKIFYTTFIFTKSNQSNIHTKSKPK